LSVELVRGGEKRQTVSVAQAAEEIFDSGEGAVEEIGPRLVQIGERSAIPRFVAQKIVKLLEGHRAAFQIAVGTRRFEQLEQIVTRDRGAFADVLHDPLVCELDDRVAEIEDEPVDVHGCRVPGLPGCSVTEQLSNRATYIRKTPNLGSSMGALYAMDSPNPRYVRV